MHFSPPTPTPLTSTFSPVFGLPEGSGQQGDLLEDLQQQDEQGLAPPGELEKAPTEDEDTTEWQEHKIPAWPSTDPFEIKPHWPVPEDDMRFYLEVFSRSEIEETEKVFRDIVKDADQRHAIATVIRHIKESGVYRRLLRPPFAWRLQLDTLQAAHPNFEAYFDHLRTAMVLAEIEDRPLALDPVALVGPPGIGKSLVAQKVAALLETSVTTLRMESAQSAAELAGSAEFWSNSRPGRVFEKLVYGPSASPIFVLEELEKTSADRFDPIAPLYGLLEADSAKTFTDLAHAWLRMDASYAIWMAACNSVESLPAPIKSRLKTIDIPAPTREQTIQIARRLWETLCREYPHATAHVTLADEALEALSEHSPRLIRKALRDSLGRAIYAQTRVIGEREMQACLAQKTAIQRMGFV